MSRWKPPASWPDWRNPAVKCAELTRLDIEFATTPVSPLHHDNRCPIHTKHRRII